MMLRQTETRGARREVRGKDTARRGAAEHHRGGVSAEVGLLLACSRVKPEGADAARGLLEGGVRWGMFLGMARRHGVAPLVYRALARHPELVPDEVLDGLGSDFRASHLRGLLLTGRLLGALGALEERGIPAIPYKGPVLAALAYGNLGLREFFDLDILVRKEDVLGAAEALAGIGYKAQAGMTPSGRAALLRYGREYSLAGDNGCAVELHWKVAPRPLSFVLDPGPLWDDAGVTRLCGRSVPTLSAEGLLLTLCVHGAAHLWERLGWVCDVTELLRVSPDLDWDRLTEHSRAAGCRRMLLLGLSLAGDLLDADVPEDIRREARADAAVRDLAARVRGRLFFEGRVPDETRNGTSEWRLYYRLMDGWRGKVRYCAHQLATPNSPDWELLPLPAVFLPGYRALRAVRLGIDFGLSLAGRRPRRDW